MARKRPAPSTLARWRSPFTWIRSRANLTEWIKAQVFEKMALLCTHYRIDPSENCWWQLAVSLACEHVPGLQLSFRPKRGRHPSWKAGLGLDLVRAVQRVMSETGMRTQDAVRKLQKDKPETWGLYTVPNLCARYREAKQHEEQLQRLLNGHASAWRRGDHCHWTCWWTCRPTKIRHAQKRRDGNSAARISGGRDVLCGWASAVCYATTTTNMRRRNARSCFDAQRLL